MLKKSIIRVGVLLLSFAAAEIAALGLSDSPKHQAAKHPYFAWLLVIITAVYLAAAAAGFIKNRKKEYIADEKIFYRAPFLAGVILVMNVLNIVTAKTALLPVLYFPTLDRVFGALFEDYALIGKCVRYSAGILVTGVLGGLIAGFFMGIGVGFSKRMSYWINPIVRILGPIPSTAWIPILLVAFPTARAASAFIIGISVWFPTVVLTSSGISNIKNSYFEVASTLGANKVQQIFKIGVPAASPSIFLGLFNGICASFIALMTAEMIGAKYGIGWYVNWQKEMMAYANVYAGLIVIAVLFYIIITVLFKIRDRVLQWQKGVIKW
ncbi:MAG: ABC transporter permease subunit [Ruminococcus sp.]|nr:ABC transporter permease subunit [Ruminococcus sp.]MCM1380495.1 ABC transporter permease subunit [Muribaculaceae bacterium]MCM1478889.1 ABC transporter permease subunit [Muribaculaceae bacterium]